MTFHFFLSWLTHLKQYTITYLKRVTFRVYLFSRAKKKSFLPSTFFRQWQVFENVEFINVWESTESKKKTWVSVKETYLILESFIKLHF